MFSFCQNKIITTGEGGAIVTESWDLFEKMKLIRSHGRLETSDYFSTSAVMDYIALGYNFRISTITAALGVAQMKKVEKIIQIRRDDAAYYIKKLHAQAGEVTPMKIPRGYHPVYQLFSVFAKERDTLIKYLDEQGIMTKIYFSPVHMTDFYKNTLGLQVHPPGDGKNFPEYYQPAVFPGALARRDRYGRQFHKNFLRDGAMMPGKADFFAGKTVLVTGGAGASGGNW